MSSPPVAVGGDRTKTRGLVAAGAGGEVVAAGLGGVGESIFVGREK